MTNKDIACLYLDHLNQRRCEEAFGLLAPDGTMWVSSSRQNAPVTPALKEAMRGVFPLAPMQFTVQRPIAEDEQVHWSWKAERPAEGSARSPCRFS